MITSLKRTILLSLILITSLSAFSSGTDKYWVGGTGQWSDASHWSLQSGGVGGAPIPGLVDNVHFDQSSFSGPNQAVTISDSATCSSFLWTATTNYPQFRSQGNSPVLSVYGSFMLPAQSNIDFSYSGNIYLGASDNEVIDFGGSRFEGSELILDGTGIWSLKNDINTNWNSTLVFKRGTLVTNDKNLCFGNVIHRPNGKCTFDLGSSTVVVWHTWYINENQNFELHASTAVLLLRDAQMYQNYQNGNSRFHRVQGAPSGCVPAGTSCAAFTITLTDTPETCGGSCDATLNASIAGGTAPFTYSWFPSADISCTTASCSNVCIGTSNYSIKVTDSETPAKTCFCNINLTAPPAMSAISTGETNPVCNGSCDGTASLVATGGSGAYTYSWTSSIGIVTNAQGQNTPNLTSLCAASYTCNITDGNGCTLSSPYVVTLTAPSLVNANGSAVNVLCFGSCTGSLTVAPTGGTSPYTCSWNPANPNATTISGLCAGATTYTCTVSDAGGCTAIFTSTISQPAAPLSSVNTTTNNPLNCNGNTNASVSAAVSGGTPGYTYSWNPPSGITVPTLSALGAGTYTLNVTDANHCPFTTTVTITQPIAISAVMTKVNLTCNAICTGKATATLSGGNLPYTYSWNPGAMNTATVTSLCKNEYTVNVTDAKGCTFLDSVAVVEPSSIGITITPTMVTCNGNCNGRASAAVSGGTGTYTYSWTPAGSIGGGGTTATATGLCPGTYSLTVTDANACTATQTIVITQPALLVPGAVGTNQSCNSPCDGSATANATGGLAAYTYSWSPGGLHQTLTNLCAGNYTVTVTDANSCVKTQVITITSPPPLVVSITPTSVSCNGLCNGTLSTSVSGGTAGYSYAWVPANPGTPILSNLCNGTYTVTVTDAHNCVATNTSTLTQPNLLAANATSSPTACSGSSTGQVCAAPTGGTTPYTYSWNPSGLNTPCENNLGTGSYVVTVTDANSCSSVQTVIVTTPSVVAPNVGTTAVTCASICDGAALAAPTGGTGAYTYSWTPTASITPAQQGTTHITNLCPGTYTCVVTDANGCNGTQIFTIGQPPVLNAVISGQTTTCGSCQGTATVGITGGTGSYTISWNTVPVQTNPTANTLCVGNYTCSVTDHNGCAVSAVATIVQTVFISISSTSTNVTCHNSCDGSASANASGGLSPYTYSWSPLVPAQLTQNAINLCAGTYTVEATDANGCFNSATVTFANPGKVSPLVTITNPACHGLCTGSASAAVTGGTGAYTYSWTPGGQTSSSIHNLCAGNYTLDVTDSKGCDSIQVITIAQPASIVPNTLTTQPSTCAACDGKITLGPTGGTIPYTYSWTPVEPATSSITGLCTGFYTCTITDNDGCDTVLSVGLSSPTGPTAAILPTPVSCNGGCNGSAAATVSGGTPPYTLSWAPGAITGQGTANASALCQGAYTFEIQDAIGCIKIVSLTIAQPAALTLTPAITQVSCGGANNGKITVGVTGGTGSYTYSWALPLINSTPTVTGLIPGTYTVTVTDQNGCSQQGVYTITQPGSLGVLINATNVSCNGLCNGSATSVVSGGTAPFTYSWSNGPLASNITNLCPGSFTVQVTDQNGCTQSQNCTIIQPAVLKDTIVVTNASCSGICDGTAIVSASGGTSPYTFLWAPGSQSGTTLNGLCAGSYSSTGTDAHGCTVTANATITEPAPVSITLTPVATTCNALCNGSISSAVTGGTLAYSFSWSPGGLTTSGLSALCVGTYTLTVTDAHGCNGSQTSIITQPTALLAGTSGISPSCNASCNGTAAANPVGGTAPYTYSWSNSATTQNLSSLCAGSYTLITTDAHSCRDTQTVVLTNPALISSANAVGNSNCGACNGTISIIPAGGNAPYTFAWTPAGVTGQGTTNISSLCAGLYVVKITDANGCSSTSAPIPLNNTGGPTSDTITTTEPTCFQTCNATANLTVVVGGTPLYTYAWTDSLNNSLGSTASNLTNLCAGGYVLTVTDAHHCIYNQIFHIASPGQLLEHPTVTQSTCTGLCNGSVLANPTGGTGAYTYSWTGGSATALDNNLCAGSYTLLLTDANGCDSSFVNSFVPSTIFQGNMTQLNPPCNNTCAGAATITMSTGTAPYTYQWTDPLGQSDSTATNLCAGTYSVNVLDANGCNIKPAVTLVAPAAITEQSVIVSPACGICNGSATITATGGTGLYTYQWSTGSTTALATSLCAGVYSVSVSDAAGCNYSFNMPLSNINGPGPSAMALTNISCFGTCNGAVTATPSAGTPPYTFSWTPGGQNTNSLSGQCAGQYFLEVSDAHGCIRTDSVSITQPGNYITNQLVVPSTCGLCNGSITLNPSGGTAPYTYSWSGGLPPTASQTALCKGLDSVMITDATGCSHIFVIVINTSNGPVIRNLSTNISCNNLCGGKDTVIVAGGHPAYTYSWTPAPGAGQATSGGTGLCAGSYVVQVTDAIGCANSTGFVITQPQQLSFSSPQVTNILCNATCNGKIVSVPSGGTAPYTYSWSPGINVSGTDSLLCAGSYTLQLKDNHACADSLIVSIIQPSSLAFTSSLVEPPCDNAPGGSITITPLGGTTPYTFNWTGSGAFISASMNLTSRMGGDYALTVTDANGCVQHILDTLKPIISLNANAGPNMPFCIQGSLLLDGSLSTNALSYHWYQMPGFVLVGDTTQKTHVTPPAGATTYELIIGNSGCTDSAVVVVTSNPPPVVSAGPPQTILTNADITIGGSPTCADGVLFHWSPSASVNDSSNSNPTVNPITTTIYTVTVTDANGCKSSDTVVVTVLPEIIFANGITPNGDGVNDLWVIDNIHKFPNNVVEVFNRWGELLFQEKDYQNDFDGTYKGKPLPVGTYYYLVDLHDPLYTTKYSGSITIMR